MVKKTKVHPQPQPAQDFHQNLGQPGDAQEAAAEANREAEQRRQEPDTACGKGFDECFAGGDETER